uniref:Uncharacterized protein n=1 Tax=Trypanosoma vivax (strain Y486) TaxID=1055687 RepID=G0U0H5_TRYVY|nr:hypothetical protein, unlikely [Trypanosoma vivax Y486]
MARSHQSPQKRSYSCSKLPIPFHFTIHCITSQYRRCATTTEQYIRINYSSRTHTHTQREREREREREAQKTFYHCTFAINNRDLCSTVLQNNFISLLCSLSHIALLVPYFPLYTPSVCFLASLSFSARPLHYFFPFVFLFSPNIDSRDV